MIGTILFTTLVSSISARAGIAAVDGLVSITDDWLNDKGSIVTYAVIGGVKLKLTSSTDYRLAKDADQLIDRFLSPLVGDALPVIKPSLVRGIMEWTDGSTMMRPFVVKNEDGHSLLTEDNGDLLFQAFCNLSGEQRELLWRFGLLVRKVHVPEEERE